MFQCKYTWMFEIHLGIDFRANRQMSNTICPMILCEIIVFDICIFARELAPWPLRRDVTQYWLKCSLKLLIYLLINVSRILYEKKTMKNYKKIYA